MNWTVPLINYRLGDEALEITIADRTVRRIPYSSIESTQRGWSLLNEHWNRRLDFWRSAVTVRRKAGLIRNLVVTPEEPDAFLEQLKAHVQVESGGKSQPTADGQA